MKEKTKIVYIPEDHLVDHRQVKEVCAGLGGFTQGLSQAGFNTRAFMDINPLACKVLEMNDKAPVICGDLLCGQDRYLMHVTPEILRCTFTSGFPCQPLSVQGDQRGESDSRTAPFHFTLKMFWEQQGAALLLECVPNAFRAPFVQRALQKLSWSMGMEFHQKILALDRTWVTRRTRWWMIMVPKDYTMDRIYDLPIDNVFCTVEDLFARWAVWGPQAKDLFIDQYELQLLHNPNLGDDMRRLKQSSKCPCILHSYGTFSRPCPCGCRTAPFNFDRLATGGLRGFYVIDSEKETPRYLHVREACALCTLNPMMHFTDEGRTCLCLIGQCAAPIQAMWMGLHLRQAIEAQTLPVEAHVKTFKMWILRQLYGAWPSQVPVVLQLHDSNEDQTVHIKAKKRPSVGEIILAEQRLQDQGQWIELRDDVGRLPMNYRVGPSSVFGDLQIEKRMKRQRRVNLGNKCVHSVLVWEDEEVNIVNVELHEGCYIFEIFAEIHVQVALTDIWDAEGHEWRADDRVWTSTTFTSYGKRAQIGCGRGAKANFSLNTWMKYGLTDVCMDEIAEIMVKKCKHEKAFWLSAKVSTMMVQSVDDWKHQEVQVQKLAAMLWKGVVWTAVVLSGHWILLRMVIQDDIIVLTSWNGEDEEMFTELRLLATTLRSALNLEGHLLAFERIFDQRFPFTCGTVALLHLGEVCNIWTHGVPDELEWHYKMLKIYGNYGVLCGAGRVQGSSDQDVVWKLRDILAGHGVPEDRTEERALAGIKKLGQAQVESALESRNPWHALKMAGSQPGTHFLWVKPDELEKQIRARAQSKFGITRSEKKMGSVRAKKDSVVIDPAQLRLVPDIFVDENGHPITQIEMGEVATDRAGLAFGTIQDVAPFVAEGAPLTMDALGVLTTLPVPVHQQGILPVQNLRYPAIYLPTGEPILIEGSLVQLGDLTIQRRKDDCEGELNPIPTKTVKITVYKDEWEEDWHEFGKAPMKAIVTEFPAFVLCNGLKCGGQCGKYHAPVDADLDGVILDLWGRSWQSMRGGRVQQKDSEQFQALLRVPSICWPALQGLSGTKGLYLEPRSQDGKSPDEHAAVIWIPQGNLANAQHRMRTMDRVQAVVRFGWKYGIRVAKKDAESAHQKIAPDQEFYNFNIQKVFELRPLPHGTQRTGVQQLLKSWKWQAKPLQPFRSDQLGAGWLVGSAVDPPAQVLPSSKGDVTVTLHKKPGQQDQLPVILGTNKTKRHMRKGQVHQGQEPGRRDHSHAKEQADPWAAWNDPWAKGCRPITADDPMTPATTRLDAVQEKLQQRIESKVSADNEERFSKLEVGMAELKQQGLKHESWFRDAAAANAATQKQLHDLTSQVKENQTEIGQVKNDIQAGFANIESLLSKKHRSE